MASPALVANVRQIQRAKLRQATFIDPQTGSRSKKRFTLRDLEDHDDIDGNPTDEGTSLLPRANAPSGTRRKHAGNSIWQKFKDAAIRCRDFAVSDTGKGVWKCSLAYLLGSLATFIPAASTLLGRQDSKHLVSTVTVYFHPARSLGSMLDALLLACTAFLYAAFVAITSMSVSVFFADTLDMMALGHALVLIIFVGGGLGFIGWVKLKLGDPLVNIASSLASLALISSLTSEGAVQSADYSFVKIAQILKMIVAGVVATLIVSIVVFPISARRNLKQGMVDVTDSLSEMLALITISFLSGDENELNDQPFAKANDRHAKTFGKLGQQLKEAKYEHYLLGTERVCLIETKLVHCLQRLTQSIGGLRSAAAMQFAIIKQPGPLSRAHTWRTLDSYGSMAATSSWRYAPQQRIQSGDLGRKLAAIDETQNKRGNGVTSKHRPGLSRDSIYASPSQIFENFIDQLGPSMKSLAFTLKEILDDLPYDPAANYAISTDPKFRISLERALEMYKISRQDALKSVYGRKDMDKNRPIEVQADWEEAAACCGHFSFSLLEVAEQMNDYLIILDELQLEIEEKPAGRTWSWMKFWRSPKNRSRFTNVNPDLMLLVDQADDLNLEINLPQPKLRIFQDHDPANWPKPKIKQKFVQELYRNLSFLRRDDTKYAIKVGIGAALYALPSFIPATRPIYSHWRGEWGLLSYMLVCSMTIGASNTTGYSRFIGTCMGAVLAIVAWEISNENPFLLAFFGFCMSYWTAYIIVGKGKGPFGRFIILTYNLIALYAYSLSIADADNDDDEEDKSRRPLILEIAMHRVVAVISGCIWGLIITRVVWPISARQKLKDGLSLLWLRMGLIWKRDPLAVFLDGESSNQYMNLREEMALARYLASLQAVTEAAKSEFEFAGPFPEKVYKDVLEGTGRMLDAFHAMNVVILKDLQASSGEEELLRATAEQRGELCRRISHLFAVLASSMKLAYPIASDRMALPSIEHTRDRLLARVFLLRREKGLVGEEDEQEGNTDSVGGGALTRRVTITDEDFGLLYTYALVTGQLGLEILGVLGRIEELFGVLDEEVLRLQ